MIYPKVTIITPCYNGEAYIERWANSIMRQDYPNTGIVFIDDGSTDNTKENLDAFSPVLEQTNIEVKYIYQENNGAAAAVASGLLHCTGDFLLLLDVDDELADNALHIFVQYLAKNPSCDIVFANGYVCEGNEKWILRKTMNHFADAYEAVLDGTLHCSAGTYMLRLGKLIDYYRDNPFYDNGGGQNLQIILPVLYKNRNIGLLDIPSMTYHVNVGSHSYLQGDKEKSAVRINQWQELYENMVSILSTSTQEADRHTDIIQNRFNEERKRLLTTSGMNTLLQSIQNKFYVFVKHFLNKHPSTVDPKEACCGCYACATACPLSCITMRPDSEGFLYPHTDKEQCNNCNICLSVCPFKRKGSINKFLPASYAAYYKDENVRYNSSSGGIFGFLARQTILQGGVVFGARLNENNQLVHNFTESLEELPTFFGSKYIQSNIGDTYTKVQLFLEKGRQVLFCGTPCQAEGLNAFLGEQYDNLLLVDFICHGVPSPRVWAACISQYCIHKVKRISFRDKSEGWKKSGQDVVTIEVDDSKKGTVTHSEMLYGRGFLRNYYLRPSCYNCKTKKLNRVSDITLADFWGINEMAPKWDDDKGLSLLLVHTEKGENALLHDNIWRESVNLMEALKHNTTAHTSVVRPPQRDSFFVDFERKPYKKVMKQYCTDKRVKVLTICVLRRVYRIMNRIIHGPKRS